MGPTASPGGSGTGITARGSGLTCSTRETLLQGLLHLALVLPSRKARAAAASAAREAVLGPERMEAAGIEPASAVAPNRTSTSVVRASSHPPEGSRTTCRRASHPEESRFGRLALPRRRARSLAPAPGPRAEPRSASPHLASTRRRMRVRSCSHLLWCRLIYEANRRPRLAALPENQPRRDLVAPVCHLHYRSIG
jgi:hypothetical protein